MRENSAIFIHLFLGCKSVLTLEVQILSFGEIQARCFPALYSEFPKMLNCSFNTLIIIHPELETFHISIWTERWFYVKFHSPWVEETQIAWNFEEK